MKKCRSHAIANAATDLASDRVQIYLYFERRINESVVMDVLSDPFESFLVAIDRLDHTSVERERDWLRQPAEVVGAIAGFDRPLRESAPFRRPSS